VSTLEEFSNKRIKLVLKNRADTVFLTSLYFWNTDCQNVTKGLSVIDCKRHSFLDVLLNSFSI